MHSMRLRPHLLQLCWGHWCWGCWGRRNRGLAQLAEQLCLLLRRQLCQDWCKAPR
jgi:hypothetical protein